MVDIVEPEGFRCPITCDTMVDPVMTSDGHSYERAAIMQWFRNEARNLSSPLTGAVLPCATLTTNYALRNVINEWNGRQPLALDPARLSLNEPEVVLGAGSFGVVVAGTLQTGGRSLPVAVKMLPVMTAEEQRTACDREIKAHIVAQQGADGVCKLLGTCEKSRRLCIVMKQYKHSLSDVVKAGPIPKAEVQRIAHILANTLAQLHDNAGVLVRDIKPSNILLTEYGDPVLADFGISSVVNRTTGIMPTGIDGTFNYMAPEAFAPPQGPPADVWALACVIVEMTTGVAPWTSLLVHQISHAVVVAKRIPDVPETTPMVTVVRNCFAFEPDMRPTAAELATAMKPEIYEPKNADHVTEVKQLRAQIKSLQTRMEKMAAEQQCSEQMYARATVDTVRLRQEKYALELSSAQSAQRISELEAENATRKQEIEALQCENNSSESCDEDEDDDDEEEDDDDDSGEEEEEDDDNNCEEPWDCSCCGFHNFAFRDQCRDCGHERADEYDDDDDADNDDDSGDAEEDDDDNREEPWDCSCCGFHNFAFRDQCRDCGHEREDSEDEDDDDDSGEEEEDDDEENEDLNWTCPTCGYYNFAFRDDCRMCDFCIL